MHPGAIWAVFHITGFKANIGEMRMDKITGNWKSLMDQAPMTAGHYMGYAKDDIDTIFGDGYAVKHPELVAAYMQASAMDFHSAALSVAADKISDALITLQPTQPLDNSA
jgi:hypothetical protein